MSSSAASDKAIGRRKNQDYNESGQAAIELAVCLPVLLLLVTGLGAYGLLFTKYLMLTDAVNEGARQLAVSRGQTTDPCSVVYYSVTNAAPTLTATNMTFQVVLNGASYSGSSCSSSSTYSGAAGNLTLGTPAKVTVTYPCTYALYGMGTKACSLVASTTELMQ
jgi:Flp pilus assembly protein TadG